MIRALVCCFLLASVLAMPINAGEIPFTVEKGFLIISAKVKKDYPIEAVVYSGSPYSFYNESLLKRLKLQMSSTNDLLSSGASREQAVIFADIPQVAISDERPVEVKMRPRQFDPMNKAIGRNLDVILGADYFDGKIVQLDFREHMLRFLDKPPVDYGAFKPSVGANSVRVLVKMNEHIQTVFGNVVSLPVGDEVMLNGSKVRSLFNTGVAFPVTVAPFAGKRLSLEKDNSGRVQLRSLSLNGYEMTDVPALLSSSWDENENRYAAIIGIGVMQNFTITFDWKNKWIVFEK